MSVKRLADNIKEVFYKMEEKDKELQNKMKKI